MKKIAATIYLVFVVGLSAYVIIRRENQPKSESQQSEPEKPEPEKTRFDFVRNEGDIYVILDKEKQIEYVIFWKNKNGAMLLDKHKLNAEKP